MRLLYTASKIERKLICVPSQKYILNISSLWKNQVEILTSYFYKLLDNDSSIRLAIAVYKKLIRRGKKIK